MCFPLIRWKQVEYVLDDIDEAVHCLSHNRYASLKRPIGRLPGFRSPTTHTFCKSESVFSLHLENTNFTDFIRYEFHL
jgi:hypothetical protein